MRPTHALLRRTLRGWLLAAALVGAVQVAHAGYAQAVPPAGFSRVGDAWTYRAANASEWLGSTVRTNATLNVAGRTVTVPAAMRMAANAPRFAASAVFANPALIVGSAALVYLLDRWQSQADVVFDPSINSWSRSDSGVMYCIEGWGNANCGPAPVLYPSIQAALQSRPTSHTNNGWPWTCTLVPGPGSPGEYIASGVLSQCQPASEGAADRPHHNPNGHARWWVMEVTGGPPSNLPLTQEDFDTRVLPYINPEDVPLIVPDVPVELPIINPTPDPLPSPRPLRVPLGDPVPNPQTSPQPSPQPVPNPYPWRQPVIDITGSPTQNEPWRVNTNPKDILLPDPNGMTEPGTPPTPQPNPDPNADPNAPPQNEAPPSEEGKGLCALYPDILACSKPDLDTPEQDIPKKTENITYTEMNVWGGGSCPSNVSVNVNGQAITALDMASTCSLITTYLRPMVIAASALSAMFILMGSRGGDTI